MKNIYVLGLFIVIVILFVGCRGKKLKPETVKNFKVNNFLGKWYEIGRITNRFEKGLVGVTATYTLKDNGDIKVLNQGYKNTLDGEKSVAEGNAKIPNSNNPSKLKVYFFPLFGADYNVIALGEDYQYALVGGSQPNYLWILSRDPKLDENIYNQLVKKAEKEGYDISKVEKVLQEK